MTSSKRTQKVAVISRAAVIFWKNATLKQTIHCVKHIVNVGNSYQIKILTTNYTFITNKRIVWRIEGRSPLPPPPLATMTSRVRPVTGKIWWGVARSCVQALLVCCRTAIILYTCTDNRKYLIQWLHCTKILRLILAQWFKIISNYNYFFIE